MNCITMSSPIGELLLVSTGDALCGVYMPGHDPAPTLAGARSGADEVLGRAAAQLGEYFAGARRAFDLPLRLAGTEFQARVWQALREIPFAGRSSYGALARALGRPSASRAVGSANRRNPISIVVPCHRVIGGDGRLTGYAGGLPAKEWLLAHEARVAAA
jgi:methylated-DNA-[protein]-cysteine S-methyltransferase